MPNGPNGLQPPDGVKHDREDSDTRVVNGGPNGDPMVAENPPSRQTAPPAERATDRRLFVALYALVLTVVAVVPILWLETTTDWQTHLNIPWLVIAVGFFTLEAAALHIEIRRETHSLSLSGLPLLLGIMSLSPVVLVLARVVGAALALIFVRRSRGLKLVWNLALFAAEASTVALVASFALRGDEIERIGQWLILLGAILLAELIGLAAVPLVIMVAEGELRLSLYAQIGRSQVIAIVASTFAVITAAALVHLPGLGPLALVPVAGVAYLLRLHGRLGKEHHDLRQIHDFAEAIGGRDSLDVGLEQLCAILRLRGAAVAVRSDSGDFIARVRSDDSFLDTALIAREHWVRPPLGVSIVEPDSAGALRDVFDTLGATRGVALSVAEGAGERLYILGFDRLGATDRLAADEVRLFQSMASALGARLSADRLLDQLEAQAQIDMLTGLANRRTLERTLDARLQDPSRPGAVLILDLDRFKDVNDSLGHHFGDELLRTIAERLTAEIRGSDLAARLGGDEFAVIIDDFAKGEALATRLDHLVARLGRPLDLDGITIDVGVSLGAAQWPADSLTSSELLRLADIAMYEAKRTHHRWVSYETTIDHTSPGRLALTGQLRDAISEEQLMIHLQPQHRGNDLALSGAEALVRWDHPEMGLIPPSQFLPIAEHSALATDLTKNVLHAALDAAGRLVRAGIDIPISVNLTSRDLLDRNLHRTVAEALDRSGVTADHLTFEVTESSLIIDLKAAITTLAELQALGCRTSADDFGTGYASLQYLQQLPLDEVKIDQSFVAGCVANPSDQAIVRSTTHLIHELGLDVVAEGIEDEATLGLVRELGCDQLQGFYFSRPLPLEDFITYATRAMAAPVTTTTATSPPPLLG